MKLPINTACNLSEGEKLFQMEQEYNHSILKFRDIWF
jgi:hypothetical protein